MMSLILVVAFISVFLLPLTCLIIFLSLDQHSSSYAKHHHSHSSMYNTQRGRSISSLLLGNTFFSNQSKLAAPGNYKGLAGVKLYQKGKNIDDDEANNSKAECGVCLSAIEPGDEIRELRCNHLFHRDCLDSWISTGRTTCPMCRGTVSAPPMMMESTQGCGVAELLVFEFCSSSQKRRHHREDNWF